MIFLSMYTLFCVRHQNTQYPDQNNKKTTMFAHISVKKIKSISKRKRNVFWFADDYHFKNPIKYGSRLRSKSMWRNLWSIQAFFSQFRQNVLKVHCINSIKFNSLMQ